jgi:predicted DsbA family dithiol-disulfide isomerase
MLEPIRIQIFHDVLCGWCCVAASRVRALRAELGDAVDVQWRPYPLRPDVALSTHELARVAQKVRRASREPDSGWITPLLWEGRDPPTSSLLPLIAAEAALLQGPAHQDAFLARMRLAAFRDGINIGRRDVILELAQLAGLDLSRFIVAFDSEQTAQAVELSHRDAVRRGVQAVPAVTFGDEWLLTGVRELSEYREVLRRFLARRGATGPLTILH